MQINAGFKVLADRITRNAEAYPDLPAIDDLRRPRLSFSALADAHECLRKAFRDNGIFHGTPVCTWFENRADSAVIITALATRGAVFPMADTITAATFERAVANIHGMALVHDGTAPDWLAKVIAATGNPVVEIRSGKDWTWWFSSVAPESRFAPAPDPDPSLIALYLNTSGSSGAPKFVPVTAEAIALTTDRAARGLQLSPGEKTLNVMALNHVHGLVSGVFLPWSAGCCTVMPGPYRAKDFLTWLEEVAPQWISCSPAIYADILRRAETSNVSLKDIPGLRFVRCGSAALDSTLRGRIRQAFNVPLLEAYGMSEALQIAGVPFDDPKEGSVGKVIADEIGIFDGETQLKAGQTGEIRLRGRTIMPGYLGDTKRLDAEWFQTGDLGHLDEDGFLFVSGRLGERMIIGGETVAPQEIEHEILQLGGISEAVVFPFLHPVLGESVMAAVVPMPGTPLHDGAMRKALSERLPHFKVPARFFIVNELPLNATGKIVRADATRHFCDQFEDQQAGGLRLDEPPQDPLEAWLQSAFARVLNDPLFGVESDFFEMGASSHDVVELLLTLEEFLGETVHVPLLFSAPTVRSLASRIRLDYPNASARFGVANQGNSSDAPPGGEALSFESFCRSLPQFVPPPAHESNSAPAFILSAPRCGSTLLRVMLAGHPKLFAPPEMRMMNFASLAEWRGALDGKYRFFRDGLVQAVMSAKNIPETEARKELDAMADQGWTSVQVMEWLEGALNGRVIVDKTPIYALRGDVLSYLKRSFPKARYIVLRRNPVDMVKSFEKARMHQSWMYPNETQPAALAEMIWRKTYETIEAFAEKVDTRYIMTTSFEDLVSDPAGVLPKICRFLRVPFDPVVLDPHADDVHRMTKGLSATARMIGDPRFKTHGAIDATRAVSGFGIPQGHLSNATRILASKIGYSEHHAEGPDDQVLSRLRNMTAQWGKSAKRIGDFGFGLESSVVKSPIFWVCQQQNEGESLGKALGQTQPLVYFRSGHQVANRYDISIAVIARVYAKNIVEHQPSGPIILGGNCQGADVARETARELLKLGREIAQFIALDADFDDDLPVRTAFFFGAKSHLNPLRNGNDRHTTWRSLYPSYTVDFLPCRHGEYFGDRIVGKLARLLKTRLNPSELRNSEG